MDVSHTGFRRTHRHRDGCNVAVEGSLQWHIDPQECARNDPLRDTVPARVNESKITQLALRRL
jgi:hypothetical protein